MEHAEERQKEVDSRLMCLCIT